jgi:CubicO group peptidase (beta-lactamase class C family)
MLMLACAPSPDAATMRPARLAARASDAAPGPIPRDALEQLVDSVFAAGLAAEKIPGGVFIMVQNGRVVLAKGYGVANVRTRQPVSPDSTLWRIGSISKVMTATGVVQLADRGKIRLDRDVNDYLRSVKVPATHREPVTARHLLTHTAGFDELGGRSVPSREAVLPLGEFLKTRLVRVRRPGTLVAYSSFGPALAGALVEDVSNLPLESYLERNVWHPLGMHDTNIVPRGAMPTGYGVRNDSVVDATWEWSNTAPAGMMNSTAADMGRFMAMMLGRHPHGRRVLSDAARRSMLTRQITMHPRIPGMGLGFFEARVNGRAIFEHGGDIDGYASLLVLLPDEDVGFFVATHVEGAGLRGKVRQKLLDRFFPGPESGAMAGAPRITGVDLSQFAGEYRWNIVCRTCATPWNPGVVRVTALGDSALSALQNQWFPVGPLLFQTRDGRKQMGFVRDSAGAIWQLTDGGIRNFERIRR